jgi:hypothetical protein
MGPSRRRNHRSLPLSFLRNKQYMRNQEFLEYARIRIRSTSTGITSNEAKSITSYDRGYSVVGFGGGIVDDSK